MNVYTKTKTLYIYIIILFSDLDLFRSVWNYSPTSQSLKTHQCVTCHDHNFCSPWGWSRLRLLLLRLLVSATVSRMSPKTVRFQNTQTQNKAIFLRSFQKTADILRLSLETMFWSPGTSGPWNRRRPWSFLDHPSARGSRRISCRVLLADGRQDTNGAQHWDFSNPKTVWQRCFPITKKELWKKYTSIDPKQQQSMLQRNSCVIKNSLDSRPWQKETKEKKGDRHWNSSRNQENWEIMMEQNLFSEKINSGAIPQQLDNSSVSLICIGTFHTKTFCTGTFWNLTEVSTPEPSASRPSAPEPAGTSSRLCTGTLRNLTYRLCTSGTSPRLCTKTFWNLPSVGTFCTLRNLARNLVLKLHLIAPEPIWAKDPLLLGKKEKKSGKHWNLSWNQEEPINHDGTEPLSAKQKEISTRTLQPGGTGKSWWNRILSWQKKLHQHRPETATNHVSTTFMRNKEFIGCPIPEKRNERKEGRQAPEPEPGTRKNQKITMEHSPLPEKGKKRKVRKQTPEP